MKTFSTKELEESRIQFRDIAARLSFASENVARSSQQIAEGTSGQASGIEETSASMEEMSSMTKSNAGKASQADDLMRNANAVLKKADNFMGDLSYSMEQIIKASEETSEVIRIIDEIAFQTNLLALNAAIEAARAGEAGSGFAVVADEVRNLALRCAKEAGNTANLIDDTVKKINAGSDMARKTSDAFSDATLNSAKAGELLGEISSALQEQAHGIEQVSKTASEMERIVQSNAANTEELSSQSEELNQLVCSLMSVFEGKKKRQAKY